MNPNPPQTLVVVGGGAAGFFGALACAAQAPHVKIVLLEKTRQLLAKVRISGGGRCNVTHRCFDPAELVKNYPRGYKALRGPFTRFQPADTVAWFESRGVPLKVEEDGRIFPVSDNSESIIQCLLAEAKRLNVEIRTGCNVEDIVQQDSDFQLTLASGEILKCGHLLLATGGSRHGFELAEKLGHTIVPPVPSLFTFNVPDSPLVDLAGIAVNPADVQIDGTELKQHGPLLITHWGFSGPAVLKLSAWGARLLHDRDYRATFAIRWLAGKNDPVIEEELRKAKKTLAARAVQTQSPFEAIPRHLWQRLVQLAGVPQNQLWAQLTKEQLVVLAKKLAHDTYQIDGKTTYKQEFVTCGGVNLDEVAFTTMESRLCPGLHFAGEILDIDGITGGFNFQAAWTTSWIAGQHIAS